MIQCYGQTESDSISLAPKEFDFYAEQYLKAGALANDVSTMGAQIDVLNSVISEKTKQISLDSLIFINKDGIISNYKESYSKLSLKYEKEKKHCTRRTNILIGSLSVNLLLVGIIWLVK